MAEGTTSPPKQNSEQQPPAHNSLGVGIEKLIHQIQSGCGNPSCNTLTCFTYRSRKSDQLLRQYTNLSAKTIAFALADHKNGAESFLCPYIDHEALRKPSLSGAQDSRVDPRSLTQLLFSTNALQDPGKVLDGDTPKDAAYKRIVVAVINLHQETSQMDFVRQCFWCIQAICVPLPSLDQDKLVFADTLQSGQDVQIDPLRYRLVISIIQALSKRTITEQTSPGRPSALLVAELLVGRYQIKTPLVLPCWLPLVQSVVVKEWSGSHILSMSDLAGQALQLMQYIWTALPPLDLVPVHHKDRWKSLRTLFQNSRIQHHLKSKDACSSWLSRKQDRRYCHIFSYEFLFSDSAQFEYFRTCCHQKMRSSVKAAAFEARARDSATELLRSHGADPGTAYLDRRMQVSVESYLVLEIRRGSLLVDSFNQLWQRESRQLHRPLRVRLGSDLGEVGTDLGGIQVEYFSLVCNELLSARYSLFDTDPDTQLSWFKPGSLEPLYRFELFGVLFGLALYNGVTLPVSFPLVFYAKLMGRLVRDEHMREGWPSLQSNFAYLQSHLEGLDELELDYGASLEAYGTTFTVDLMSYTWKKVSNDPTGRYGATVTIYDFYTESFNSEIDPLCLEWPGWTFRLPPPSSRLAPVTRQNVNHFIATYNAWKADYSVRPQFTAFAAGFYRVVDMRAIQLLSPQNLRQLVEGYQEIVATTLKQYATYEGYTDSCKEIRWFWSIVEEFSQDQLRLLLVFVTACKRLPANSSTGFKFVICDSRDDEEALPRSSTCFSMLHLPRYKTKEKMQEKLNRALEHSLGFGQA